MILIGTRCAAHYSTHDSTPDLHGVLQRASVYVSNRITHFLEVRLNGRIIKGDEHKANFHLEKLDDGLKFYLPEDEVERKVCFERSLPRRFMAYLKITDPSAQSVLGTIFREDDRTVIERILDDVGIACVTLNDYVNPRSDSRSEQQQNSSDRNARIGAAGELYVRSYSPYFHKKLLTLMKVFRYLQNIGLHGFSASNWTSDCPSVLHGFRERIQRSAPGRDILADIEYDDTQGQFTKFLISKGHLKEKVWRNERPCYYLEVKTSPRFNRQEPFFMSGTQYRYVSTQLLDRIMLANITQDAGYENEGG